MEQINPTEKIKTEIATLTQGAEMITVTTRSEYEVLAHQEDMASAIKKQVEDYFNPDIQKANELHKSLTAKRKVLLDPLEAFIKICKRVGGAYLCQEQEKARQQAAALAEQAEKAGIDTSLIPQEAPKVEAGEGRALVQTWVFDVVDESKVPREYLILDEVKIRKVVQALKDKTNIPGIVARMEASVRRTGK